MEFEGNSELVSFFMYPASFPPCSVALCIDELLCIQETSIVKYCIALSFSLVTSICPYYAMNFMLIIIISKGAILYVPLTLSLTTSLINTLFLAWFVKSFSFLNSRALTKSLHIYVLAISFIAALRVSSCLYFNCPICNHQGYCFCKYCNSCTVSSCFNELEGTCDWCFCMQSMLNWLHCSMI